MLITIERLKLKDGYTIGRMLINGKWYAHVLEDEVRDLAIEPKVPGKTAIPYGTYEVITSMSNRFKRELPEILNVPFFKGIRIHGGNKVEDSEGCPLIGAHITTDERGICQCATKVNQLIAHIKEGRRGGKKVYIEIKKGI